MANPRREREASGLNNQIENPMTSVPEDRFTVTNPFPGEALRGGRPVRAPEKLYGTGDRHLRGRRPDHPPASSPGRHSPAAWSTTKAGLDPPRSSSSISTTVSSHSTPWAGGATIGPTSRSTLTAGSGSRASSPCGLRPVGLRRAHPAQWQGRRKPCLPARRRARGPGGRQGGPRGQPVGDRIGGERGPGAAGGQTWRLLVGLSTARRDSTHPTRLRKGATEATPPSSSRSITTLLDGVDRRSPRSSSRRVSSGSAGTNRRLVTVIAYHRFS